MIIQAFSGEVADLRYLLINPTAQILAGNPDQIAELIRCSPYRRRFTSLVLSFNEELEQEAEPGVNAKGILTMGRLLACVHGTLRFLAPEGMRERLAHLAVIHSDKGRTEVHILIPNVDLATCKQYTPYFHLRDAKRLRDFQEAVNLSCGFTDPEDIERQLSAMPNPRMGNFPLISEITSSVQHRFQNSAEVTVNDVADYLESSGYRIQKTTADGKKQRLCVFSDKGQLVRLPGIWFRADFDLKTVRAKKRRSKSEIETDLMRRFARFKELTAKSHSRNREEFDMKNFPASIKNPIEMPFFSRFFSGGRWEDRKISILQESLFSSAMRRTEWIQDLSAKLKSPILDTKQLLQGDLDQTTAGPEETTQKMADVPENP